jgi:hypothetical protein
VRHQFKNTFQHPNILLARVVQAVTPNKQVVGLDASIQALLWKTLTQGQFHIHAAKERRVFHFPPTLGLAANAAEKVVHAMAKQTNSADK